MAEDELNYRRESIYIQEGKLASIRTFDENDALLGEDIYNESGLVIEERQYSKAGNICQRLVREYDAFRKELRHILYDDEGDVVFSKEKDGAPEISDKWRGNKPYTIAAQPNWRRNQQPKIL